MNNNKWFSILKIAVSVCVFSTFLGVSVTNWNDIQWSDCVVIDTQDKCNSAIDNGLTSVMLQKNGVDTNNWESKGTLTHCHKNTFQRKVVFQFRGRVMSAILTPRYDCHHWLECNDDYLFWACNN